MNRTLGLLCAATIVACPSSRLRAQMPTARVVVRQAKKIEARPSITLVGTVEPLRRSRLGSEIRGLVVEMPARQGDLIPAGGTVCKLDATTRKLQLAAEQAKLASLSAFHAELVAGTRPEELRSLKARLDETIAFHDRWKFEMQRIEKLFKRKDSNDKEYQDTRSEFLAAQRRMVAAEAAYNLGLEGPRKERIARAAHDVVEQQAVVDRMANDVEKTVIRAPFEGYVGERLVELGEWIPEGGAVVEMMDLSRVLVRVDVPETALAFIHVGDTSRVMIDALGRPFEGTIKHVIRQAAPAARTFPVEIEIDNGEGVLAGGMFARATVPSGVLRSALVVPKDALVEREGVTYLALVVPARKGGSSGLLIPVTVGIAIADWITVTSGNVKPGAAVITRGTERMFPFPSPIEIVDENGSPVAMPTGAGADRGEEGA